MTNCQWTSDTAQVESPVWWLVVGGRIWKRCITWCRAFCESCRRLLQTTRVLLWPMSSCPNRLITVEAQNAAAVIFAANPILVCSPMSVVAIINTLHGALVSFLYTHNGRSYLASCQFRQCFAQQIGYSVQKFASNYYY